MFHLETNPAFEASEQRAMQHFDPKFPLRPVSPIPVRAKSPWI
jgi:hypothetical protein